MNSTSSFTGTRQQRTTPRRDTPPARSTPTRSRWLLQALVARAMQQADTLSVLLRGEDPRTAAEVEAVARELRARHVEAAVRRHAALPWTIETETGVGGLALAEQHTPRIARASAALRRAMARLKLYSRYRLLPAHA